MKNTFFIAYTYEKSMIKENCMDIKQLRYFLTIVEEGQISAAAKRLHMAQPPLSQQLKTLENELEIVLIERTNKSFKLTDAGKMLSRRAEQILELVKTTENEIKDIGEGRKGTLTIGTIASLGASIIPEKIASFNKEYPDVNYRLWEGNSAKITELLLNGVIEIGIVRLPIENNHFESILFPKEPMLAVASNKWLDKRKTISINALQNKPLLLHKRHEEMIKKNCLENGFEPNILCVSDDIRTILPWAEKDLGIAIVAESIENIVNKEKLQISKIKDSELETAAAIIWVKNRYLSPIAKLFLNTFSKI